MKLESFVHLELNGPADEIKAFIEGFRLASGERRVYSAARENIKTDGFLGSLVSKVTHYVVPAGFVGPLSAALEASDMVAIRITGEQPFDHAEMKFEFRCFSREIGAAIRSVVESDLPAGVILDEYTTDEDIDDDAKGAELYSPVHEYVASGRGRYHGPIDGIIVMARRLDDQDFIHPGRITLV